MGLREIIQRNYSTRAGNIFATVIFVTFLLFYIVLPFIRTVIDERSYEAEQNIIAENLSTMLQTKDEEITYDTNNIYSDGIMYTPYKYKTAFIDYTDKTVGFLFNSGIDKFKFYRLTQVTNNEIQHPIQQEWELNGLGKKLTTYYLDEENSHRTIAIRLEMADGTVYLIDNINVDDSGEYLGIK